jgi:hypothetical protein
MRTIIDISDEQVKALDELSQLEQTSRVALIRRAIDKLLAQEAQNGLAYDAAFGLWEERAQKAKAARRAKRASASASPPIEAPAAVQQLTSEMVAEMAEAITAGLESELVAVPEVMVTPSVPTNAPTPVSRESTLNSADPLAAFFLAGRGIL